MNKFKCSYKEENYIDIWFGKVESIINRNGYYEILILSRSSIIMFIGKSRNGIFACIPDFNAGCYLATLDNISYNSDKLKYAMKNHIDALTVAVALDTIKNKLLL